MSVITDEASARAYVAALPGVDAAAMARLDALAGLLIAENSRQNLVSAASLGAVWCRHIADSAQLLAHVSRETDAGVWLDLGSGGGFPGLVIAALRPERAVWLIESRNLRAEWLERARLALGLAQARVVASRLEMVPPVSAAVISARAFAPLDKLLALAAPFSSPATLWLLPKGRGAQQELAALKTCRHTLRIVPSLTAADSHIILGEVRSRPSPAHKDRNIQ